MYQFIHKFGSGSGIVIIKEERSLELVAGIKKNDVGCVFAICINHSLEAGNAAIASVALDVSGSTFGAALIERIQVGVNVVGVEYC